MIQSSAEGPFDSPRISHGLLFDGAADAGFPAVTLGTFTIAGETAWRRLTSTPAERRALLGLLAPALMALDGGACRLSAQDAPADAAQSKRELRERIAWFGDAEMMECALDALLVVPSIVRAMALTEIAFVGGRPDR